MSNKKDSLGDRMKCYEAIPKNFLMRRTPVVIRLDGAHFHTFTKGFDRPFDNIIVEAMQTTAKYLCEKIHGCVMAYTQSDEITLVLCDYQTFETEPWFNYNVQKMVSTSAAMATIAFSHALANIQHELWLSDGISFGDKIELINRKMDTYPTFDARCFNLSKEEVNNCLVWRQQDAIRNSIQALAQAHFSQRELQGVNCRALDEKLIKEKGVYWDKLPTHLRRGSCVVKIDGKWVVDKEIPVFSKDKNYVESRINFEE